MIARVAARCAGVVGLFLILSFVRVSLIPFIVIAAFCGAMIAAKSRARGPDQSKQGELL